MEGPRLVNICYQSSHISKFDLSRITAKLAEQLGWNEKYALKATEQYRRFLFLLKKYQASGAITPTKDIDVVWHLHILATVQYEADCQVIFGKYLHHRPFLRTEILKGNTAEALQQLGELYYMEFREHLYNVRPRLIFQITCSLVSYCKNILTPSIRYVNRFILFFKTRPGGAS